MENKVTSHAVKGLILGLILITISVLTYVFVPSMEEQSKYSWISYLIIAGGIAWASYSYAAQMNGNVTFGQTFSHGFKTATVLAIIMIIYTVLAITVIFPELKEKAMDFARQNMEKGNNMDETQIDKAIAMTSKFFLAFAIAGIVVMYLLIGAIGALLGAGIAKKNPNPGMPE